MGFTTARSGALVAPSITRFAAEEAKERSSTLKESRKFLEEQRYRRAPNKKDKVKGDDKGDDKGKGKGKGKEDE